MDRENALKEAWQAELIARLALLDGTIGDQASRAALVRERGWDATTFEKRSRLLKTTRQHDAALLDQLLLDGKLPMRMWRDLNPDVATDQDFSLDGRQAR